MGYKTISTAVTLSTDKKNADLGTFALKEDAIELKGVDIVSEKSTIEQKIDRKIINVGKDLISAGATVRNNEHSLC
jgi:hypothetical protein